MISHCIHILEWKFSSILSTKLHVANHYVFCCLHYKTMIVKHFSRCKLLNEVHICWSFAPYSIYSGSAQLSCWYFMNKNHFQVGNINSNAQHPHQMVITIFNAFLVISTYVIEIGFFFFFMSKYSEIFSVLLCISNDFLR